MVVGYRLLALASSQKQVCRVRRPHARPHQRHLDGHIHQVSRLHPGDGLQLCRRLHLEDANGVSLPQHAVYRRVLVVYLGEVNVPTRALLNKLHRLLELREGTQREEVNLHKTGIVYIVLVPLAYVATFDGPLLHRHQLSYGARTDDHPARVLGQEFGEAIDLGGKSHQVAPQRGLCLVGEARQSLHLPGQTRSVAVLYRLGQLVHPFFRQAQGFADVAHRPFYQVGIEHACEGGVLPTPPLVHPFDKTFTDIPWEVQVHVGHAGEVLVEESLQGKIILQGVNVGEADEVAYQERYRGASTAARRVFFQASLRVADSQFDSHFPGYLKNLVAQGGPGSNPNKAPNGSSKKAYIREVPRDLAIAPP